MIDVNEIVQLHQDTVERWHREPIDNLYEGLLADICQQHSFNYRLWHEEDIARCPDSDDSTIAKVKRAIDGFNQQRNDWIEKVDDHLSFLLEQSGVALNPDARLNSETPGSIIDRMSILALRIYHLYEQLEREEVSAEHLEKVQQRIAVCRLQRHDLATSLTELLSDIVAGLKRHRTYRQLKMYNDPTLNPYLYNSGKKSA